MTHYICTGDCGGVSPAPKSCDSPVCSNSGKPLIACDCTDQKHHAHNVDLIAKKCIPCDGGVSPITGEALTPYLTQVPEWKFIEEEGGPAAAEALAGRQRKEENKIQRVFKFKDFAEAMVFVNKIAVLAEEEGHHPDINIHWNTVTLSLWTHEIGGLSENDFIVAAKIDRV